MDMGKKESLLKALKGFWLALKGFWLAMGIICLILFSADIWLSGYSNSTTFLGAEWKWNWGLAAFLAQLFYVVVSFRIVGPTELGAMLFFGKPLYNVKSGLNLVPFLVCRLVKNTRNIIEIELPTRPELIFRSELEKEEVVPKDLLDNGYKPPIRVQFGAPGIELSTKELESQLNDPNIMEDERKRLERIKKLYETLNRFIANENIQNDPLNVRMTAETPLTVRLKIKSLVRFLITFDSLEKAKGQIQDIAVAMLNREFSKITPAVAQAHLGTFSELIKEEIAERIESNKGDGGIEIVTVLLRPFGYSHKLNASLQSFAEARAKKRATVIDAEAQKEKDTLEGEGKGAAEKAIIDGRTEGFKGMMEKLGVSAQEVLGAEIAREFAVNPGQKTVIVGQKGFADVLGIAAAIGETFKEGGK